MLESSLADAHTRLLLKDKQLSEYSRALIKHVAVKSTEIFSTVQMVIVYPAAIADTDDALHGVSILDTIFVNVRALDNVKERVAKYVLDEVDRLVKLASEAYQSILGNRLY